MTRTFSCVQCGTVDIDTSLDNEQTLCYECTNGEWHGMFEKEQFDPKLHLVDNEESVHDEDPFGVESFS